jgi:hypothetical protein
MASKLVDGRPPAFAVEAPLDHDGIEKEFPAATGQAEEGQ